MKLEEKEPFHIPAWKLAMIPNLEKNSDERENCKPVSLMDISLNKIPAKRGVKKVTYRDPIDVIPVVQGWVHVHRAADGAYSISRSRDRNPHDLLNRFRKCLWQNPTSASDKSHKGNRYRRILSQSDKSHLRQTCAQYHISGEKLKAFPLKSGPRPGHPSPLLFSRMHESLTRVIR